jgi:hypothetical protein
MTIILANSAVMYRILLTNMITRRSLNAVPEHCNVMQYYYSSVLCSPNLVCYDCTIFIYIYDI